MGFAINSFTFVELSEGSGEGRLDIKNEQNEARRKFKIAWPDMPAFVSALRGGWTRSNSNQWVYAVPDVHPDWPAFYCHQADYKAFGIPSWDGTNKTSAWDFAEVSAIYRPLSFDALNVLNQNLVEESLDFSAEIVQVPLFSMKESSSGKAVETPLTKVVPLVDYSLSMANVPELPGGDVTLIMSLVGKVNKNAFKGATPGTVRFDGGKARRRVNDKGLLAWDIQFSFKYRPLPWNTVLVNQNAAPVQVEAKDGSGKLLYDDDGGSFPLLLPRG